MGIQGGWPNVALSAMAIQLTVNADDFGYFDGEFTAAYGLPGVARSLHVAAFNSAQAPPPGTAGPLGRAPSGPLNMRYIRRMLARLRIGNTYELMCHPGRDDSIARKDAALRRYHDWTGELECLLGREFRAALDSHAVRLTRFRDLQDAN